MVSFLLYLARRFRENSRQYFGYPHHSALGPSSLPTVLSEEAIQASMSQMILFLRPYEYFLLNHSLQNQLFLDQLSAKLTGSPSGAMPVTSALPPPVPTPLNRQVQTGIMKG